MFSNVFVFLCFIDSYETNLNIVKPVFMVKIKGLRKVAIERIWN